MTDEYKRGLMRAAAIARSYDGGGIAGEKAHDIAEDIMAEIPGPMGQRVSDLGRTISVPVATPRCDLMSNRQPTWGRCRKPPGHERADDIHCDDLGRTWRRA